MRRPTTTITNVEEHPSSSTPILGGWRAQIILEEDSQKRPMLSRAEDKRVTMPSEPPRFFSCWEPPHAHTSNYERAGRPQ